MGRGPEETFFQRRYTDSQQIHYMWNLKTKTNKIKQKQTHEYREMVVARGDRGG